MRAIVEIDPAAQNRMIACVGVTLQGIYPRLLLCCFCLHGCRFEGFVINDD